MMAFYLCPNCGYPTMSTECSNCKEEIELKSDLLIKRIEEEDLLTELRLADEKISKWKFRGAEKIIKACLDKNRNSLLLYFYALVALETSIEKDENIVYVDSINSALKRFVLFFSSIKSALELDIGARGLIIALRYLRSDSHRHDIDEDAFSDIEKKLVGLNPIFRNHFSFGKL